MDFNLEWDDDGYPVDVHFEGRNNRFILQDSKTAWEWLKHNLEMCCKNCCASYELIDAIDIMDHPTQHINFTTGGWSGAETLIGIIEGQFWAAHLMLQWRRGGHYIFERPYTLDGNK
jgi:hypothetical protein